ncbi:MAG: hypothetical protein QG607_431 [Patescibacteria group bacterium]|nr:hypothetical protein [Patescibacteria group bacterium]
MIVFAALIPNSPLLVKRGEIVAEKTLAAISEIERMIEKTNPDTLLIISQHAKHFDSVFTLPFADKFVESLKRFGFISEHLSYSADAEILSKLQAYSKKARLPLRSVHSELLDNGSGIALRMLGAQKKKYSIVTLGTSDLSIEHHVEFGHELKEILHSDARRIAVIVTGETGNSAIAHGIIASLGNRSVPALRQVCESATGEHETLCRPLAIGYGLLRDFPAQTNIVCDEEFGGHSLISGVFFSD